MISLSKTISLHEEKGNALLYACTHMAALQLPLKYSILIRKITWCKI